jgi:hypothetical protein
MHTDHTLELLDKTTIALGEQLRSFASTTCPAFDTRELQKEAEARKRRELKKSGTAPSTTATPRQKFFNLQTYKYHSLGDYANTIRRFGTCDSYTTERVSTPSFCKLAFLEENHQRRAN